MAIVDDAGIQCYIELAKTGQPLQELETSTTACRCSKRKNVQYVGVTEEGEFSIVVVLDANFEWDLCNALSIELHFDLGSEVKNQIIMPRSLGLGASQKRGHSQTAFRISNVETPTTGCRTEISKFAFKRRTSNGNSPKAPEDIHFLGQIWLDISRVRVKEDLKTICQTILERSFKKHVSDIELGPSLKGLDYSIRLVPGGQESFLLQPKVSGFLEKIPENDRVEDNRTNVVPPGTTRAKSDRKSRPAKGSMQSLQDSKETDSTAEARLSRDSLPATPQGSHPPQTREKTPDLDAQYQDINQRLQYRKTRNAALHSEKQTLHAKIKTVEKQIGLKRKHEELVQENETFAALEPEVEALRRKLQQLEREK